MERSVVFPAPLGPRMPKISPSSIWRLIPFRTHLCFLPNQPDRKVFEIPSALIANAMAFPFRIADCRMRNQFLKFKASSKNIIPAKAGIYRFLTLLDSRLRGSDKLGIIRGSLNFQLVNSGFHSAIRIPQLE